MEQPNLGAPDLRIHYVRIINNLPIAFTDRFDGVPIKILPGASENLPLDMASHMFGYFYGVDDETMFRHTCRRQGWNTPKHLDVQESGKTLAQDLWDKLDIKPVIYKMVEEKPDLEAPIPADPELPALPPRRKAGAA
jgi:hypothetical protein